MKLKWNSKTLFALAIVTFMVWLVLWALLGFALNNADLYQLLDWPHPLLVLAIWLGLLGGILRQNEAVRRRRPFVIKVTNYSTGNNPHGSIISMRTVRRVYR